MRGVVISVTRSLSNRSRVSYVLALVLIVCLGGKAAVSSGEVEVLLDGRVLPDKAFVRDSVVYLSASALGKALGLELSWDPVEAVMKVNGKPVYPVIEEQGKFFLPAIKVAQLAGAVTHWYPGRSRLEIETKSFSARNGSKSGYDRFVLSESLPPGWRFPVPDLRGSSAPGHYPGTLKVRPLPGPGSKSPAKAPDLDNEVFIPRHASNGVYRVTVTNVEIIASLKGYYRPRQGYRYIIVYLSQKNITPTAQVDPGVFKLEDDKGNVYPVLDELSNFYPVIFRPYGINFGYQVYELPKSAVPKVLILETAAGGELRIGLES